MPHFSLCTTLSGHTGCVNRLAWNDSGTLLASGSDDKNVIVRRFHVGGLFTMKNVLSIKTGHRANIFGVAFIRGCNDSVLATGGMDTNVRLHTLREDGTSSSSLIYKHSGRVKAVSSGESRVWLSAGEDGHVCQFDAREKPDLEGPHVVASLSQGVEVKHVAVNPQNPLVFAVAASDAFIRVFDRRKTGFLRRDNASSSDASSGGSGSGGAAGSPPPPPPHQPTLRFAPALMAPQHSFPTSLSWLKRPQSHHQDFHATHVDWNEEGDELVASYSGHGVYTFAVNKGGLLEEGGGREGGYQPLHREGGMDEVEASSSPPSPTTPSFLFPLDPPTAAATLTSLTTPCPVIAVDALLLALHLASTPTTHSTTKDSPLPYPAITSCPPLTPINLLALEKEGFTTTNNNTTATSPPPPCLAQGRLLTLLVRARLARKWRGDVSLAVEEAGRAVEFLSSSPTTSNSEVCSRGGGAVGRWVCAAILALALALKASLQEAGGALVARRLLAQLHFLSEQQQQQHTSLAPSWGAVRQGRSEGGGVGMGGGSEDESPLNAMIAEVSHLVFLLTSHPGAVFTPSGSAIAPFPPKAIGDDSTDPFRDCPEVAVHRGGEGGGEGGEGLGGGGWDEGSSNGGVFFTPTYHPSTTHSPFRGLATLLPLHQPLPPPPPPITSSYSTSTSKQWRLEAFCAGEGGEMEYHHQQHQCTFLGRPTALFVGARNTDTDIKEAAFWRPGVGGSPQFHRLLKPSRVKWSERWWDPPAATHQRGSGGGGGGRGSGGRGGGGGRGRSDSEGASDDGEDDDDDDEEEEEEEEDEDEDEEMENEKQSGRGREARACWGKNLGVDGYIVAGSDDGRCWVYDKRSTLPVAVLAGDSTVTNCCRPHPSLPLLATSGIDETVKLWCAGLKPTGFSPDDPEVEEEEEEDGGERGGGRRRGRNVIRDPYMLRALASGNFSLRPMINDRELIRAACAQQ